MGQLIELYHKAGPSTYAGRLDPLAEGVSIILSGKDRHRKDAFLASDKEYLVDVLFGIGTDTHDPLGLASECSTSSPSQKDISAALSSFQPEYNQVPPIYSSQPIQGEAAFALARRGIEVSLEPRPIKLSADIISYYALSKNDLLTDIEKRIALVQGDFRQREILESWRSTLGSGPESYTACKLRVTCISGGYMRSLARDLGERLNTSAIAHRIVRTRVGHFRLPYQE